MEFPVGHLVNLVFSSDSAGLSLEMLSPIMSKHIISELDSPAAAGYV